MGRELKPFKEVTTYSEAPAAPPPAIDLRRLTVAMRRQRRTMLLPAVLLGALGLAYAAAKPETFSTSSSLLLDSNVNRAVQQAGGISTVALPSERIENARVVLESEKLANDVLERTGLQANPSFMNPPRSAFSSAIGQTIATVTQPISWTIERLTALLTPAEVGLPAGTSEAALAGDLSAAVVDPERRLALARLRTGIRVARVGQSSSVAVTYASHDPVIAAQVANAYADAYVEDILTSNADSVGQTNAWMRTRMDELRMQAQEAADAAERFAAENRLVEFSSGGLLTEQALNELNSSLTTVLTEAARAQAVLNTYDRAVAGGLEGLTNSNSALAIGGDVSEELRARLDSYNDVQTRLQRLLNSSGPNHPQVAGLQQTLATTAERLFVELQARRAEAQSTLDVANARVEALQQSVEQASEQNSAQAANFVRLRALQEEAATLSQIYQQTLARSQEIEQQQSFPVANVRILSYAPVPNTPSGPAVLRTALAATLLGLFFGMAIAAWREWRERSLRTAADVTERSGLRFLGHLPVLPPVRKSRAAAKPLRDPPPLQSPGGPRETLPVPSKLRPPEIQAPVPVLHYPDSVYAETLRHVRLAAEETGRARPVTGVTSFHPFEGRSSVAFNLAGQLGIGLDSVLLIDADSRARTLSRMLGIDREPGLTDAAAGRGHWHEMLFVVADTNLVVLPCGLEQGGPSDDLLTGRVLSQIAAEACEDFGRVIVDVPPLYPVAQGRAILHDLPQFLIVGEWGRTPRSMAETALEEDPRLEARCLGVVYDRVNLRKLKSFLLPGEMENYLSDAKSYLSMKRRSARG
ncbi:GNVR domain-containing protein [Paracoccus tibetensis]|uniref:Succinoglycan biosynthesis transport protein ExoP n=1 Tax=Paracoccus tibetensis TaxID=336292 RepID=A0A1G5K2Z2_9RHOB|nr:GNVR domain-containing protein [Paracoccus tibetensis]SCY94926.1 succinoglycan biosynthesis transport protein ExoP [Paracoccus tibetensis]